jgi:hypothetical protein
VNALISEEACKYNMMGEVLKTGDSLEYLIVLYSGGNKN